jgi:hypothetical protein
VSAQSFWALLRNPIYAGRVEVARWGIARDGDFGRAVSGSLSRARSQRYAYYHCPKCPGVRGRTTDVEQQFRERLDAVQMAPAYMRLLREIVLDVWRVEQAQAVKRGAALSARVADVQRKLERLDDVFIYQ